MGKNRGITILMFGVVGILLIVTLALGVATAVKQGKEPKTNNTPGKKVAAITETPVPTQSATDIPMPTETPTPTPTETPKYVVFLDPGQQRNENKDTEPAGPGSTEMVKKMSYGATSVTTDMREHEWNLIMANLVKDELEARGYKVVMSRDNADVNISNGERAVLANESGADIHVGIQADAGGDGVKGVYAQVPRNDNPFVGKMYNDCRSLATYIKDAVIKATGAGDRGFYENNSLAEINYSKIPVVIMQLGFMSNREEDTNLQNAEYRQKMAVAICDGIDEYFKAKEDTHD